MARAKARVRVTVGGIRKARMRVEEKENVRDRGRDRKKWRGVRVAVIGRENLRVEEVGSGGRCLKTVEPLAPF